ncbi:MAG: hypothetical protein ACOCXP_03570 [Candidatus Dojkabacteria bacterium]
MQLPGQQPNQQNNFEQPPQQAQPIQHNYPVNPSNNGAASKLKKTFKNIFSNRLATFLIVSLQVAILGVLIVLADPQAQYERFQSRQIVSQVEEKAEVNENENPTLAIISNVEQLREANEIQQEVYKDAQNDDYILAYSDKIVIYRPSTDEVIYEGLAPADIFAQNQQQVVGNVVSAAVEEGLVTDAQSENPEVLLVQEPERLRAQDAEFYALAEENDVISYFPAAERVILYRPSEEKILNSGSYRTVIE